MAQTVFYDVGPQNASTKTGITRQYYARFCQVYPSFAMELPTYKRVIEKQVAISHQRVGGYHCGLCAGADRSSGCGWMLEAGQLGGCMGVRVYGCMDGLVYWCTICSILA